MNSYQYAISAKWRFEPLSPTEIGDRFLRTLDLIVQQAPQTAGWGITPEPYAKSSVSIDEARGRLPQWVENNIAMIDGEPDAGYGYRLHARKLRHQSLGFSAAIGGEYADTIDFEVGWTGLPSDPDVVTYPLFKAALSSILSAWSCDSAYAYVFNNKPGGFPAIPGITPNPSVPYHRFWIGYLSAKHADGLKPSSDLPVERTPDNGLIMTAAESRLDPANPDHMRRANAIAEIMARRLHAP